MDARKINVELSISDWNYILTALGKFPYNEVSGLIAVIQEQAKKRIAELQEDTVF